MNNENTSKSSTSQIVAISSLLIVLVLMAWYFLAGLGYRNREATLRSQFSAVMAGNKVDYDAMWKIITENFQVAQVERETFANTYEKIVKTNDAQSGQTVPGLLLAVGLRPPQVDSALYRKVQDEISSQRTKFSNAQKDALDIKREHDTLRTTWPGSMFVGDRAALVVQLVTSTRTEKAFETGKDDQTLIPSAGR